MQLTKWDCLDDGDDALLIMEANELERVLAQIKEIFLTYGMVLKCENVAYNLPQVLFCQSNPIEVTPGSYVFVRNPSNVMSKALTGMRHWDNATYRRRAMATIGRCELALHVGVPVLQEYALALIRNGDAVFDLKYVSVGFHYLSASQNLNCEPQPVQLCARLSFQEAFGITIAEQIWMETKLSTWTISNSVVDWGSEIHSGWILAPSFVDTYRYD
jgi:hypothetical protein